MSSAGQEALRDARGPRQEDDLVASRRLVVTAAAAMVVALLAVFAAGLLLRATTASRRAHLGPAASAAGREIGNLEQTPILVARDGLDLRDHERDELARTRWIDRDGGIAAIPIERAMDLVERADRGAR
jgi:hypothetical protein